MSAASRLRVVSRCYLTLAIADCDSHGLGSRSRLIIISADGRTSSSPLSVSFGGRSISFGRIPKMRWYFVTETETAPKVSKWAEMGRNRNRNSVGLYCPVMLYRENKHLHYILHASLSMSVNCWPFVTNEAWTYIDWLIDWLQYLYGTGWYIDICTVYKYFNCTWVNNIPWGILKP